MRAAFIWDDIPHWTGPDLIETVMLLADQEEVDSFLAAYAEVCEDDEHALHNLKYMAQLVGGDDGNNIAEMFGLTIGKSEVISPRNWFADSSCGVKVSA